MQKPTKQQIDQARRFAAMIQAAKEKIRSAATVSDLQMLYAFGLLNIQQITELQSVCLHIYSPAHHNEIQAAFSRLYMLADAWERIAPTLQHAALCPRYEAINTVLNRYWNSGQVETDPEFARELTEKSLQIFREQYKEERMPFLSVLQSIENQQQTQQ